MIREEVQSKAIKLAWEKKHGVLFLAPRVGKTKIGLEISKFTDNVLVTYPYNVISESWVAESEKWDIKLPQHINQRMLHTIDWVPKLVIADEVHTLSEKQLNILKNWGCKVIGLTGSLSDDTKKSLKQELQLPVIYEYSIEQAIKDGLIADYKFNVVLLSLDDKEKYLASPFKSDDKLYTEKKHYEMIDKQFNRFKIMSWDNPKYNNVKMMWAGKRSNAIYNYKKKVEYAKRFIDSVDRCLIFTARTEVADYLGQKSYHSKTKEDTLSDFIEGNINKLSAVNQISMGITIPDLKLGIFHQLNSSEESQIQKSLRMLNLDGSRIGEIYIFCYANTQDEAWVVKALQPFDNSKIQWIHERSWKS